jgi:hypothetical protein
MKIPYILTDTSLTVVIEGKAHTMHNSHPAWLQAKSALAEEKYDLLGGLFDLATAVEDYFDDEAQIQVRDSTVLFEGEVVHNLVVEKILKFMRSGSPFKPLVKFLGKLMENPSRRAVNELYAFLEHKNMPITPDGNFLAYKGVGENFKDKYTGKFDNSVGNVLDMKRNSVCDDANIGCSHGFHAGSYEYAKSWAGNGGNLMIVEIDPSDVVSVPLCSDCQKLRTSKYKVVGHYETLEKAPLADGYNDSYSDNEGEHYDAGYEQAKEDYGIDD